MLHIVGKKPGRGRGAASEKISRTTLIFFAKKLESDFQLQFNSGNFKADNTLLDPF